MEWLLQSPSGRRVGERLFSRPEDIYAPHLIDLEVIQALRLSVIRGSMDALRAAHALEDFLDLPIERHDHESHARRIWDLRDSLRAYDAAYVALAEFLGATLITCDAKLRAASGHIAHVEVV